MSELAKLGRKLNEYAAHEADIYIKRGKVIKQAKEYFASTKDWLAWSHAHLGVGKSTHYHHIKVYEAFESGLFGNEMKAIPTSVLYKLATDSELLNQARLDMARGVLINNNWLKENK